MRENRRREGWRGHLVAVLVVAFSAGGLTAGLNVTTITFEEGFMQLFGDGNLVRSPDDHSVRLQLDRYSGSGFISSGLYSYGLFSAKIKLPSDYTAGVVVAFYTSNGDIFEKTHDELDFEFLGNIRGREWKIQTNVYGNGSTNRGREERYLLPFDPTLEAHRYSILWAPDTIIFYIDDTPIREVRRNEDMGSDYPSKPMSLYATIWDGSSWATSGGKYKVNYKYSPFVSEFSELVLRGCRIDPLQQLQSLKQCVEATTDLEASEFALMTPEKRRTMLDFRMRHMVYSVCYDVHRYPEPLPECDAIESERQRFKETGHVMTQKAAESRRRAAESRRSRSRRRSRLPAPSRNAGEAMVG